MALNYEHAYAWVDPNTNRCRGVITSDDDSIEPPYVRIPVYDPEYYGKYYLNGNWYEDAEGTIPWTSSLI